MNSGHIKTAGVGVAAVVAAAIGVIEPWEGRELRAYRDIVGVWTICQGLTDGVKEGDTASIKECDERFFQAVSQYEQRIRPCLPASLPAKTRAAFISTAYNIGTSGFCASSMARLAKAGNLRAACQAILSWNKASFNLPGARGQQARGEQCSPKPDGRYLCTVRGLTNRRSAEASLCLSGL